MTDGIPWHTLLLTLKIAGTAAALNFLIGVPVAYILAKKRFFGKDLLDTLLMQPMVMPPTVLGYYLLVLFGSRGIVGQFLQDTLGVTLVFTWKGAVLAAAVSSLPLFVKPARAAIESVGGTLENTARLLGKTEFAVFRTVTFPLALRGILAGGALAFARSLGEFGATLMIAGNIPHRTQTVSIAIYDAVQAGNTAAANTLVLLITAVSIAILYTVNKTMTNKF